MLTSSSINKSTIWMFDSSLLAAERDKCLPFLVGTAQADALWTFCCSEEEERQSSLIEGNESLSVLSESTPQKPEYCLIARGVLRQHSRFWAENSSRSTSVEAPMHVAVRLNAMYIMKFSLRRLTVRAEQQLFRQLWSPKKTKEILRFSWRFKSGTRK